MRSRLHVHVYCSATMVGWVQCQNSKGRGPMSNFVSVKNFEIFSNFVLLSLINIDCSSGVPASTEKMEETDTPTTLHLLLGNVLYTGVTESST